MQTGRFPIVSEEFRSRVLAVYAGAEGAAVVRLENVVARLGLDRALVEAIIAAPKNLDATPNRSVKVGWDPGRDGGRTHGPGLLRTSREARDGDPSIEPVQLFPHVGTGPASARERALAAV